LQLFSVLITTPFWFLVYKNEPMRFLIAKSEKGGMNSSAYTAVKRVLRENYGLIAGEQGELDTYAQVC